MSSSDAPPIDREAQRRAANRFDIRRLIGGLLTLYGIVLIITGIVGDHHVKTKAAGINIDLWGGIGMLIVGLLMLFWAFSRPTEVPEHD